MKTPIAIAVAATLALPQMAMAQRVTTPGTADRHAANLAKADEQRVAKAESSDKKTDRYSHVNAAKAGKVNTAKALKSDDGR